MGTPNFANPENASCVYVVGFDDKGDCVDEDFYYDNLAEFINYLMDELIEKEKDKNLSYYHCWYDEKWDGNRNYSGRYIGELDYNFFYLGIDITITVKLKVINGYYEGANLDYEIEYSDESQYYEDYIKLVKSVKEYPEDYGLNNGLVAIHAWRLENKLDEVRDKLTSMVESIYKRASQPYYKSAQFSNGEAIYSRCNI